MTDHGRNLFPVTDQLVSREEKEKILGNKGLAVWFTGLSGSGKTTLGKGLERALHEKGILVTVLDGDNLRTGLNSDLGFSLEDRRENIRRVSEAAKLLCNTGVVTILTFVSPTEQIRQAAKDILGDDLYLVYVNTSVEECERRDTKGLYQKARKGEIKNFTGVDSPFEPPTQPDVVVDTENMDIQQSIAELLDRVLEKIKI